MKGWSKLEQKLNNHIQTLAARIQSFFKELTPKKSKEIFQNKKELLKKKQQAYYSKLQNTKEKLKSTQKKITSKASQKVAKAKSIDVKKVKLSHVLAGFTAFLIPVLSSLKAWYLTLKPKTLAIIIAGGTTVSLASLNIYVQSKKIADESTTADQAELVEKLEKANSLTRRPTYFKKEEKQFKITSVFLPIYLESNNAMKRLEIDFTIQASNKYIRAYFNKNHYLVRDALNTEINPISVDFPLKQEGKVVIKEKIKKELNILLDKIDIQGEVTEVYIHSIFGG
jgi:hypothetical protein